VTGHGKLTQELDDGWHEFWTHLPGHHDTSAAQPAATATIEPNPREEPVSNLLTEAKNVLHDGLAKLEAIDEGAVNVMDAIKVNQAGVSIVNTLASIAHLPDPMGLLSNIDSSLKAFAVVLQQGAQATAPAEPSFTPAGPVVGGQA
jgi:hypothetical protein